MDRIIARMEVVVFFAAICIFAVAMPQTYAEEEDEPAVREARRVRGAKGLTLLCLYEKHNTHLFHVKNYYRDMDGYVCVSCTFGKCCYHGSHLISTKSYRSRIGSFASFDI